MPKFYDPNDYPPGDGVAADLGEAIARAPADKRASILARFDRVVRHIVPALNERTGEVEDVDLDDVEITADTREGFYRLVNKAGEHKVTTGGLILGALAIGGTIAWKRHHDQKKEE